MMLVLQSLTNENRKRQEIGASRKVILMVQEFKINGKEKLERKIEKDQIKEKKKHGEKERKHDEENLWNRDSKFCTINNLYLKQKNRQKVWLNLMEEKKKKTKNELVSSPSSQFRHISKKKIPEKFSVWCWQAPVLTGRPCAVLTMVWKQFCSLRCLVMIHTDWLSNRGRAWRDQQRTAEVFFFFLARMCARFR